MATLALFAVMTGFTLNPALQTEKPNVIYMGRHPQQISTWSALYKFDCGERQVIVDIAVSADRASVSKLDLGRGDAAAVLPGLNAALANQHFEDVLVTCARTDPYPRVVFLTAREKPDGGSEPSSVATSSVGSSADDVALED